MIDGLQSEDYKSADIEVSDDLTVADLVSGTELDLYGSTVNVANITVTGSIAVAGAVSGGNAFLGTSFTDDGRTLSPFGTGSPTTTWGARGLAGTGETGTGSNAWHTFPTAFGAAPIVVATSAETNEALVVPLGSIGAGSFYVETTSASQDFSWVAIG